MMLHVATGMPLPHGFFSKAVEGPFTATSDTFRIKVIGKGGHGAAPELTTDPLLPLAHILTSLETIRTRGISAFDPVVLTVGQVHGGAAANVIASEAFMEGTFRTFKKQNREKIKERIRQIAENIAEAYGAKSEVKFFNGCPSVVIDRRAAELFNQTISSLLGSQALIPFDQILPGGKIMGSEDFGFYTEYVPSVMSFITAGDSRKGYIYPPHHPKVRFSEEPLYIGAAAYAAFALNVLA
jgi:hippurate hydrolase